MIETQLTTQLGFRDITKKLREGIKIVAKHDVVRGVVPDVEVTQNHQDGSTSNVYYFIAPEFDMRGRIFPMDEVVELNKEYDIIVQKYKKDFGELEFNIDANPYHDFFAGERFKVRISRNDNGEDPLFKLFNRITGFVKRRENPEFYEQIKLGNIVLVEVISINRAGTLFYLWVNPLEIIGG